MLRKTLLLLAAALALFHVWLFASQIVDGRLADPASIARWIVAGGLVLGLASLRRQGASLVRGRKAVSIWLLAALLHAPAVADRVDAAGLDLPAVAVSLVSVTLGAGLVLAALTGFRTTRPPSPLTSTVVGRTRLSIASLSSGRYVCFAPRPPPIA